MMRYEIPMKCHGDWMGPREGGGTGKGIEPVNGRVEYKLILETNSSGAAYFSIGSYLQRAEKIDGDIEVTADGTILTSPDAASKLNQYYGFNARLERVQ